MAGARFATWCRQLNEEGKTIFFSTHILSDAETLCDRVAVLNKGELKGVGVVADLLREVSGEVEVVCSGAQAIPALSALGARCHATGDVVRALLPERRWKRRWPRCARARPA